MKKIYSLFVALFFCNTALFAQVGIGTTSPDSQLDIRSSNQAAPANNDGILIPKVDVFPATNPTVAQQGMLVYLTTSTTFLATTRQPGFYYWNNPTSDWIWLNSGSNGDHDWYEVGTTVAPDAITDNMFHMGNAAIGKNTANYPLEVNTTNFDKGILNTYTTTATNGIEKNAFQNDLTFNSNDNGSSIRTNLSGTGNGTLYGNYSNITNTGTGNHFGAYNDVGGNGTGFQFGTYNNVLNNGNASHFGTSNVLGGTGNGFHYGVFNTMASSGTGGHYGIYNSLTGNNASVLNGIVNSITSTGNAAHYGVNNDLTGTGSGIHYANYSSLSGIGTGAQYGQYTTITNSGNAIHYGNYNTLTGTGTGLKFGIRNEMSGGGSQFGEYNYLSGAGTGVQTGSYTEITNSGGSAHYGMISTLSGTGAGNKTGLYSFINTTAGGTHYGVYSEVLKAGATNFAGYFLGNVGIGTTGANIYTLPPSRGTNGQIMVTNGAGVVSWQNTSTVAWTTTGNAGLNGGNTTTAGTNFLGTTDNQNIDFRTNNLVRGRFSNLGEFFVGTLNTVLTGDLCNAVGNATFPWALNGYTDQNGAGTYGQVTSGTTIFAGVQGEYNGTNAQGAGVRGLSVNTTAGTGFNALHTGVTGNATTSGTYKFGVAGSGGTTTRTGGVLGYDYGLAIGALGYYGSAAVDYSVYGFGQAHTNGVIGGRSSNTSMERNTNIGLGIYGGVMGGWVRGMKYGFHTKGETYSLYVDGSGYTNKPLAYLINTDGASKTASYMSTSMKPEVTVNGKIALENGKVFVPFDKAFRQIISNIDDVVITASPQGKSNGVYIDQISKEGFWIYENNDGVSNVKISWIAITKIKGEENPEVPADLLANDFDTKMDKVMFNENNTTDTAQSLWWDGGKIRWDRPVNNKVDTETEKLSRPKAANDPK